MKVIVDGYTFSIDIEGNVGEERSDLEKLKEYISKGKNVYWDDSNNKFKNVEPILDASTTIRPISDISIEYNNNIYFLKIKSEDPWEAEVVTATPMKILVNSGENGNVILPISSNEYCKIDWGDGTTNAGYETGYIKNKVKIANIGKLKLASARAPYGFKHCYETKNKDYTVTILGSIERVSTDALVELSSSYDPNLGTTVHTENYVEIDKILEIIQWGETGIKKINLSKCKNLRKIANPDEYNFFNVESFDYAFSECERLTGEAPELWNYGRSGVGCFLGCTLLDNYNDIPEEWK